MSLGRRSLRRVQAVRVGGQPVHHRVPVLRQPAAPPRAEAAARRQAPSRAPARRRGVSALLRRGAAAGARATPRRARAYARGRWASDPPLRDDRARGGRAARRGSPSTPNRSCYEQLAIIGPLHGDWWRLLQLRVRLRERRSTRSSRSLAIAIVRLAARAPPRARRRARAVLRRRRRSARWWRCARLRLTRSSAGGNAARSRCSRPGRRPTCARCVPGGYYEGDLLGAGAFAALLLALPFARPEAELAGGRSAGCSGGVGPGWLAGVVGAASGCCVGAA